MARVPDPPATKPATLRRERVARVGGKRPWIVLGSLAFVAVLLVALLAWLASSVLSVRESLERAQALATQIKSEVAAEDIDGAIALVDDLTKNTSDAAEASTQPVWRIFELVPFVGPNLTAVRQIAAVIDDVATDAVQPMVDVARDGFDSFRPVNDRIDVERVEAVAVAVAAADASLADSVAAVERIDTDDTLQQVVDAKDQLAELLASESGPVADVRRITDIAPALLGADGPRNYILLFPNNAESVSLGGNTAAWLLITVTNGLIAITEQPSSDDFDRTLGSPIPLPPELGQIYDPGLFSYVTNTQLRPHFPTAGALAQGFWARKTGQVVDGVVSFDPIALSYLLEATGPLTLPSGHTLAADNAVKLLLSDVYSMYTDPSEQDDFFAQAAAAVFTALTTSTPDVDALITALTRAIDDDRLMAWSDHPEEQAVIARSALEGTMATDNVAETEIGVFFVENSASKMSYYLQTAVTVNGDACAAPAAPTFTASIDLHSAISPADYDALPDYVKVHGYGDPVKTRTLVYVYGPVGASHANAVWNGNGLGSGVIASGTDLGRPVVALTVDLRPGDASNVTVVFTGGTEPHGPLTVRVTPMVQPTVVTDVSPRCN